METTRYAMMFGWSILAWLNTLAMLETRPDRMPSKSGRVRAAILAILYWAVVAATYMRIGH